MKISVLISLLHPRGRPLLLIKGEAVSTGRGGPLRLLERLLQPPLKFGHIDMNTCQALLALALMGVPTAALAGGRLSFSKVCAGPGQHVEITGTEWRELSCVDAKYYYYFDGTKLGESDANKGTTPEFDMVIPSNAIDAAHNIRVELHDEPAKNRQLVECVEKHICVLNQQATQPWSLTPIDVNKFIRFDPSGVCSIPPCDEIKLIQIMHGSFSAHVNGDGAQPASPEGLLIENAKRLRKHMSLYGYWADTHHRGDPFYDRQSRIGVHSCGNDALAEMHDTPNVNQAFFTETGTSYVKLSYEVLAFCYSGNASGEYLGHFFWDVTITTADQAYGIGGEALRYGTLHTGTMDSGAPSDDALDAISAWAGTWTKPKPTGREKDGGQPCAN